MITALTIPLILLKLGSYPETIHATITIPPHEDNEWIVFAIDEPDEFYRSTVIQIDGKNGPVVNEVWFDNIPSGKYLAVAILYRRDKKGEAARAVSGIFVPARVTRDDPKRRLKA